MLSGWLGHNSVSVLVLYVLIKHDDSLFVQTHEGVFHRTGHFRANGMQLKARQMASTHLGHTCSIGCELLSQTQQDHSADCAVLSIE